MIVDLKHEKCFMATVNKFEASAQDLSEVLNELEQWCIDLTKGLEFHKINDTQLNEMSLLAQKIGAMHTAIDTHIDSWVDQWQSLRPAQAFAEKFDDKLILLVYGKFNAGKSSFCNFFAERFKAYDFCVQYFQLEAGHILLSDSTLKEGVTETTAQLQGIILGNKLVLLDTPGLHSTTQENSELTKRFTDSADGVLWLSSSASPGQVQELDELGLELKRRKPLLPVLTRSDFIEEDEVDGAIKKLLRNKTTENRQLQECDVNSRAQDKLVQMGVAVTQLKIPLSISVRSAQDKKASPIAMKEAGFERLYESLFELIAPVIAYKKRKSVEILLHHLEENVIGCLSTKVVPQLDALTDMLIAAQNDLQKTEEQIMNTVWRNVISLVPEILNKYESTQDVQAVYSELGQHFLMALSKEANKLQLIYAIELSSKGVQLQVPESVSYEKVVVEQVVVGVSYDALYTALEKMIHVQLKNQVDQWLGQCELIITELLDEIEAIRELLSRSTKQLNNLIKLNNNKS